MLHLYDTRTRKAQEISPMDGKTLRFYCCGPTVYAPAHIGNFRTFIMQDVFRRVVELGGTATTHVRNLTDVDDKTIRDSRKAAVTLAEFTATWADKFHRDCQALNCLPPHVEPSAVAHIPEQIEMVKALVEKGHAYPSEDGSVYFGISLSRNTAVFPIWTSGNWTSAKPPTPVPMQTSMKRIPWRISCFGKAAGRKTETTTGRPRGEKDALAGTWNAPQ